jgi:hypothetical protein
VIVICICLLSSACSQHAGRISGQSKSTALQSPSYVLDSIREKNQSITQFKGIGTIKLARAGHIRIDERMAWAMVFPDKMRIEIRAISGVSLASLAYNGKRLSVSIPSENRFIEEKTRNAKLTKLIAIPIRAHDLMQTLAGRIPVRQNYKLLMVKEAGTYPFTLVLSNRWNTVIQKIYLDATLKNVEGFAMFNQHGSLEYQVLYKKMQKIGEYHLPSRFKIASRKGDAMQIDVDRYWLNIPISPSLFKLMPSSQNKKASFRLPDTKG